MPLGIYPTVDYVFKRLFGSPENADLLIHLLNAVLKPAAAITQVEIQNPFLEKEFEEDKLAVLDIRACDIDRCWFNIEMQTTVPSGLRERLVYYTSCLYIEQMAEGMQYRELLPTISICFLTSSLFPRVAAAHLHFALADLEHGVSLTDRIQIHTVELTKYNQSAETLLRGDSLDKWTFFLKYAAQLEATELQKLLPDPPFRKATGVIEMISQSPEQRRLHDARIRAQRDYFSALEGAKAEAREQGLVEGREVGIEQGIEQGIEIGECIATIQWLRRFLNEPPGDKLELEKLEPSVLQAMAMELRGRFEQLRKE